MSLDPKNFTEKTNSVLVAAQDLARSSSHVELVPAHLVKAMYEDADGLLKRIVTKAGGQPQSLERGFEQNFGPNDRARSTTDVSTFFCEI
jgi:ATP-dependent Clp protease ATP-binding subunit ClpB